MTQTVAALYVAIMLFIAGAHTASAASSVPSGSADSPLAAVAGIMDLRGVSNNNGETQFPLHGEWEFHWMRLLEPMDWRSGHVPAPMHVPVPSSWRTADFGVNSPAEDGYGYGTYRLLIHVPDTDVGQSKGLFIRSINSAYRLWIDGQEKSGLGVVGVDREREHPQAHINLVFFQPQSRTIELVIQASNHSFREGGMNREIVYGDTAALIPYILKKLLYDIFVIGGFLMIGLFHLVVYGMRKKDSSALWVGVLALAISLRTLFISGYLSSLLLHLDSWELLVRLEYSTELVGFMALIYLMRSLYPAEVNRRMVQLSLFLSIALFLFVQLTPARIYTESMMLQTALKAGILLYFVFYVGVAAVLGRREGAWIHLLSLLLIIAAAVNDTLYYLRAAPTVELLEYSIVPFIMAQAIVVSYRHSRLSQRNELLRKELEGLNATLELKVEQRTQSLYEANRHLSEMRDIRSRMLTNIAHDLGSPIVGIQMHLKLMAEGKVTASQGETTQLLLDNSQYIQRLVHDLFELSKLESGEIAFHFAETAAGTWIRSVCETLGKELSLIGFSLQVGKLETACADGKEAYVRIDQVRMMRTFRNMIDNAVKFSRGKSDVILISGYVQPVEGSERHEYVVEVADQGIGMDEEELERAFLRLYKKRKRNERGSGLGLAIVKEIVTQHLGEVGARSVKGEGSVFYFRLPVVDKEA